MATVKLGDVVDIEIYQGIQAENNPESTVFFESGVIVRDRSLDEKAALDTNVVNATLWRDLDPNDGPGHDSDSDTRSTPSKIVQGEMQAKRAHLNKSWAARDLTSSFTQGEDGMTRMRNRTGAWWQWQQQFNLLAITQGIYNANVAGNITPGFGSANDMILDISAGSPGAPTTVGPTTQFHYEGFVDAQLTMGDNLTALNTMLIHPVVYARLKKNNDIEFVKDSENMRNIPTYAGFRVIVSDRAPALASAAGPRYLTILYGAAVFGFGMAAAKTPFELFRDPSIGDGAGEDIWHERQIWLMHPFGHSNLNAVSSVGGATPALNAAGLGLSQSFADLRLAVNWERTYFRRNVPFAFFVHN